MGERPGPEHESLPSKSVMRIVNDFFNEIKAHVEGGGDKSVALLFDEVQRKLEELSPSNSLVRDARLNYSIAIAMGQMALEDSSFLNFFESACDDLELDMSLDEALDSDEKDVYKAEVERLRSQLL